MKTDEFFDIRDSELYFCNNCKIEFIEEDLLNHCHDNFLDVVWLAGKTLTK